MEEKVIIQNNGIDKQGIRNTIVFLLLLIPFFQIDYLVETISWMPKAYSVCHILAGIVIILLFIKDRLFKELPPLFILFIGLFFVMCLAGAVSGSGVKTPFLYCFATLVLCLITEYAILKDIRHFLKAGMIFFGTLVAGNLLSVILFKDGMYQYLSHYKDSWLLGFKSGHLMYQLAFLFFAILFYKLCTKKRMYPVYAGVIIIFISDLLVKNRMGMIVMIVLAVFIFIPRLLKFTKVFNILTYTGVGVFLNLIFVFLRKQEIFEWLIVGIFHRRMDLTHRTDVWDSAFRAISERPVIGHGYETFVFSDKIVTTHNEYLEILFKTGYIGLAIFLVILAIVIYKLFKNRKKTAAQWIALILGAFFVMFVLEQYAFVYFFYILIFAYHSGDIEDRIKEQDRQRAQTVVLNNTKGRTEKSARNFLFTIFASVAAILIGLIAQKLFINILGLEYAGLNGLFSNVIAILAIADLGIGEAVIFNLYKPLSEGNKETIQSLMRFYRKAFHIIAGVIAVIGLCIIPALPYIAKTTTTDINVTVIYVIFLADVVLSYFLSYKRAILYADQKNFIISIIHICYLIAVNTGQLLVLYFTRDYYVYLLIKVAFRILENVVITRFANRLYPYLKQKEVKPLDKNIKKDIKKKTGALVFHKIGTFVVNGTDNILISVFLGLITAGLYNNYFIVIDAATKLISPAIGALTPSVGSMLVTEDKGHVFQVFRRIRFMNFWIASFAATAMFVLVQPFIGLWFGEQYLLPTLVVVALSLQFFQVLMRGSYNAFQDAAGIFYENRFVPLFESALNLAASLILLQFMGLAGIFVGTIVSSLALWAFSYPKFVYTKLFGRSLKQYAAETLGYLLVFLAVCAITALAVTYIPPFIASGGWTLLLADAIVCFIVSNGLLALIFFKTDCFHYFLGLIKKKIG